MATVEITPTAYLEPTEAGTWRVAGTRVSLEVVVFAYRQGESPETIRDNYPTLTLEQVHGVIAHYLRHREAIDEDLREREAAAARLRVEAGTRNAELHARVRRRAVEEGLLSREDEA